MAFRPMVRAEYDSVLGAQELGSLAMLLLIEFNDR